MTVIDLAEAIRVPAIRDEESERGETLSRWLAVRLRAARTGYFLPPDRRF
jgi:hypothetical protein